MASADQISCRNLGRQSWASAPTKGKKGCRNRPGQRRRAERLRRGWEEGVESRQRSSSKGPSTLSNPSVTAFGRASSLCTREPWGRGCGLPRRPCGPPRNDNGFLSFRGQCAHWSWESVLFTMDGGVGRPTKDEGNGTPSRRALRKAQLITRASRRAAKRPRPRPRGIGGNRRKDHPKRGTAPAAAQAALSEAESAGRAAGQIRVLPDDLRVQHGAPGSEISAKPRPCSRRSYVH